MLRILKFSRLRRAILPSGISVNVTGSFSCFFVYRREAAKIFFGVKSPRSGEIFYPSSKVKKTHWYPHAVPPGRKSPRIRAFQEQICHTSKSYHITLNSEEMGAILVHKQILLILKDLSKIKGFGESTSLRTENFEDESRMNELFSGFGAMKYDH